MIANRIKQVLNNNTSSRILGQKINNKWEWTNRKQLKNKINYCIDKLKDNNINKNDRVIYKGKNSVEWASWNIATLSLGAVWVPIYHNQKDSYTNYIMNDCTPKLLISDDKTVIESQKCIDNKIENFNYNNDFEIVDNDISTLIYTSGTTGNPKGVTLSHNNIVSNVDDLKGVFNDLENEMTSLNILPWAHIYGLTTELYYNMFFGNKVAISSGPDNFIKECREIKPDALYLVPKVLESIKTKLSFLDKPIVNNLTPFVLRKLFGGNLITIFMGGAKLDDNTKAFYLYNGVNICEGYGCSEVSPMVSVNHTSFPRDTNSIGYILPNVEVEIVDGEIQVSGPNVMQRYWNNEEETNKAIVKRNGKKWYKTGDSGYLDNNFLYYLGRINENYKLSNGKFVNVNDTESKIKKYFNNHFIIYGNNKPYNILITDTKVENDIIEDINRDLDSYLKIEKVLQLNDNKFADYLTPKMSIKRKLLISDFKEDIDNIYS